MDAANPTTTEIMLGVAGKLAHLWAPAVPIFAAFALCLAVAWSLPPRNLNRRGWSLRRLFSR